MEILRFSNHFSQINEQGNKSCSLSLTSVGLIYLPQVSSAQQEGDYRDIWISTFKLHLFTDRLSLAELVCPAHIPLCSNLDLDCLQFSE